MKPKLSHAERRRTRHLARVLSATFAAPDAYRLAILEAARRLSLGGLPPDDDAAMAATLDDLIHAALDHAPEGKP